MASTAHPPIATATLVTWRGMDFGAVTDHTWSGIGRMLVEDEWAEILDANRQYHEPDRFVSIPAI